MDAGKFNNLNFGNIGPSRFTKAPGPTPNQEAGRGAEEKGPRDEVNLGFSPLNLTTPDVLPTDSTNDAQYIVATPSVSKPEPTFSFSGPLGLNALSDMESQKFTSFTTGLTAVNGINSTSLFSVGGVNLASVNPLNPTTLTRMPTTSVSTFGIEDTQFVTSSGRVISADNRLTVPMPTTSVTTFGLEDNEWLTTSGRTISLAG